MPEHDLIIRDFVSKVRLLLAKVTYLKKEKSELEGLVAEKDKEIERLVAENSDLQTRYDAMLTSNMLVVSDADREATRKKINTLIRNVNRCITLLNDTSSEEEDESEGL